MDHERLLRIFADEAALGLEDILSALLDLEDSGLSAEDRAARKKRILSELHSLKGGSFVVPPLRLVGEAFHHCETIMESLSVQEPVDSATLNTLVETLQWAREAISRALAGEVLTPIPIHESSFPQPQSEAEQAQRRRVSGAIERTRSSDEIEVSSLSVLRVGVDHVDQLIRDLGALTSSKGALDDRLVQLESLNASLQFELQQSSLNRGVLTELLGHFEQLERGLREENHRLSRLIRQSQNQALRFKRLPFSALFGTLRMTARDLAQRTGKDVQLVLSNGDIQLDKLAHDQLKAPLIHLMRNSFDHGFEEPHHRAGKAPKGTLKISASEKGDRVVITVEDDGRGIDETRLREKALRLGVAELSSLSLLDVLCLSGLSSKDTVSEISGRGVGLGAVRESLEDLGGRLSVRAERGVGTCFTLSLPHMLATQRAFLIQAHEDRFCIPLKSVSRILKVSGQAMTSFNSRPALLIDNQPVPVLRLSAVLGLGKAQRSEKSQFILIKQRQKRVALEVEGVLGQIEMVMDPFTEPVIYLKWIEGVVAHSDGGVIPVLRLSHFFEGENEAGVKLDEYQEDRKRVNVLIVYDSPTTQSLERSLLEGAGMQVSVAEDGQAALEMIQGEHSFDLVISDLEMPRRDGLSLLSELRRLYSKDELPFILITSVQNIELKEKAFQEGASGFIGKSSFDPETLLSMIARLLPNLFRSDN